MKKLHILILLLLTLSLTGCLFPVKVPYNTGDRYQSVIGFQENMEGAPLNIGISCDKLEFDINDVYLNIYWAVIEDFIPHFYYENNDLCYYLGVDTRQNTKTYTFTTKDLYNISDFITLELFKKDILKTSNKYTASFNDKGGIEYNYFKQYHIPSEAFKENIGVIKIVFCSVEINDKGELFGIQRCSFDITYMKLDLTTVKFRGEWREN